MNVYMMYPKYQAVARPPGPTLLGGVGTTWSAIAPGTIALMLGSIRRPKNLGCSCDEGALAENGKHQQEGAHGAAER